jgi:hypothetical protein
VCLSFFENFRAKTLAKKEIWGINQQPKNLLAGEASPKLDP